MSVLVNTAGTHKIYTKGAPETVKQLLHEDSIPLQYDTFYRQQMRLGRRVLAMASRDVGSLDLPHGDISKSRNTLENQLQFVGFLVFDSPLKADSTKVVQHLRKAGLEIIMITGDSLLTAVEVARRVGLVKKHHTVYELCDLNRSETLGTLLGLIPINRTDGCPSDQSIPASSIQSLVDCTVCATGDIIDSLNEIDRSSMVPYIKIFARHVSNIICGAFYV
jgi:magnesium-transporting ATPase (P-type)